MYILFIPDLFCFTEERPVRDGDPAATPFRFSWLIHVSRTQLTFCGFCTLTPTRSTNSLAVSPSCRLLLPRCPHSSACWLTVRVSRSSPRSSPTALGWTRIRTWRTLQARASRGSRLLVAVPFLQEAGVLFPSSVCFSSCIGPLPIQGVCCPSR
ncbi:hypothetical protein VTG60DRAFT_5407 [Thermothelomyces hinnuleus]